MSMEDGAPVQTKTCCFCCQVPIESEENKQELEDCCDMPCCLFAPYKESPFFTGTICMKLRKNDSYRLMLSVILGFFLGLLITLGRPMKPESRFCYNYDYEKYSNTEMDLSCSQFAINSHHPITDTDLSILRKELPFCLDSTCSKSINVPNDISSDTAICYGSLKVGGATSKYFLAPYTSKCEDIYGASWQKLYIDTWNLKTVPVNNSATISPPPKICLSINTFSRTSSVSYSTTTCPSGDYSFNSFMEDTATSKSVQDSYMAELTHYNTVMDYTFKFWGDLWFRALKLIILPLLVANLITATSDITEVPNAGKLGCYTFLYYFLTTFLAAIESLIFSAIILVGFLNKFSPFSGEAGKPSVSYDDFGDFITGLLNSVVDTNIIAAVTSKDAKGVVRPNYLGVIFFCLIVGMVVPRKDRNGAPGVFLMWFRELNDMMFKIIHVIILLTPLGLFLLTTWTYATLSITELLVRVSLFLGTIFTGLAIHLFLVYPALYFFLTRKNPYVYFYNLTDAAFLAFVISSSIATLPVTMKCAEKNKIRPEISKFVLSLGATINMDGTTIGFPCAVIFIAYGEGITLTFGQMVLIVLLSTVYSMGAAPIPQAGLVLLMLMLQTLEIPLGSSFYLIYSVDWLYDRAETMVNIVGDSFAAGIMDHYLSKSFTEHKNKEANAPEQKGSLNSDVEKNGA